MQLSILLLKGLEQDGCLLWLISSCLMISRNLRKGIIDHRHRMALTINPRPVSRR